MNKEEIKQKDKEDKVIKFYTNYIENQEKELDWMYRQDEEYYRDEIEQKELLIKGFKTILNLIQKQEKEIELLSKKLYLCTPETPQHEHQEYVSYVDLVDKIIKQEKIIDKMADFIRKRHENWISREEVKEYFKKESEKK